LKAFYETGPSHGRQAKTAGSATLRSTQSSQRSGRTVGRGWRSGCPQCAPADASTPLNLGPPSTYATFHPQARLILIAALNAAASSGARHLGSEHLLLALLDTAAAPVVAVFTEQGVTSSTVREFITDLGNEPAAERLVGRPACEPGAAGRGSTVGSHRGG
jgi:hypothetical protein